MPGVTKHIYDRDILDIHIMWNKQLKEIEKVLPREYKKNIIIECLKKYYPYEWKSVEYKKMYYDKKDQSIIKKHKKTRYRMPSANRLLEKNLIYKNLQSLKIKRLHKLNFNDEVYRLNCEKLWNKRKGKIEKITKKINNARANTQMVTPEFLDKLMGLYERKNTSQKDKVYIIIELMKYYNPKIIAFFYKLNDTELNRQLREMAFKHLQSFNFQPRLRKQKYMVVHTKNKKRKKYLRNVYPFETFEISGCPEELAYRIENGKEQQIKSFDYFISHSSKDHKLVQKLITYENKKGKNVFCDWINDSDYLKRSLLCKETLEVIEWRLKQSKAIIFVKSDSSLSSVWCKYELNYFLQFNRPIYFINKKDIENDHFNLIEYDSQNFYDTDYKDLINLASHS